MRYNYKEATTTKRKWQFPHLILAHDYFCEDGFFKAFGVKGWVAHQHDEQHTPKTPHIRFQPMRTASHHLRASEDECKKLSNIQLLIFKMIHYIYSL